MGAMFQSADREFARAVAALPFCNPFLPERVQLERKALGSAYRDLDTSLVSGSAAEAAGAPYSVWHFPGEVETNPNHEEIDRRLEELLPTARGAALQGKASEEELDLHNNLVLYALYRRYQAPLLELVQAKPGVSRRRAAFFQSFAADAEELGLGAGLGKRSQPDLELIFAWFFQVRRAFHTIYRSIMGGSQPAAELRAAVWQSVFTHDMRRYRRGLYQRMGDITTLITGPTGTGKELVARAIGLSRFIPFDADRGEFVEDFEEAFFALNLSALSPTLLESELFGHKRGSFTGAIADRRGWLEVCPAFGAVFLDEIGEVSEAIQVKLLRVLETRDFQRLGESKNRRFLGKLIAATHRDPAQEQGAGRMREDFYYRLCSDQVRTPSLAEQLANSPDELGWITHAMTLRLMGSEEAPELAATVLDWIQNNLGESYSWPGNFRELEQCIYNVTIRGRYQPASVALSGHGSAEERFATQVRAGDLDTATLLNHYTTLVFFRTGSYVAAAKALGTDRRTVKARVDQEFLKLLRK